MAVPGRKRGSWSLLPEQHRKILRLLRSGVGIRKTASIVGVGVRSVQRRYEIALSFGETSEVSYVPVRGRHCPEHGLVTIWPCVACAAAAARRTSERN